MILIQELKVTNVQLSATKQPLAATKFNEMLIAIVHIERTLEEALIHELGINNWEITRISPQKVDQTLMS